MARRRPAAFDGPAVLPDNTPPFHTNVRIYLTAPDGAGRVRLTTADGKSAVVAVRAGRTVIVDPLERLGDEATGPILLRSMTSGDVYVSRTLYAPGAHGPLTTAEQPTLLPAAVRLPPVAVDPRAAVR